jgi:hypothetical protein
MQSGCLLLLLVCSSERVLFAAGTGTGSADGGKMDGDGTPKTILGVRMEDRSGTSESAQSL